MESQAVETTPEIPAQARPQEEIQKEYEAVAAQVGQKTYIRELLTAEIQEMHKHMLSLNHEMGKLRAVKSTESVDKAPEAP